MTVAHALSSAGKPWYQRQVDATPLRLFRAGFGCVVLVEVLRYAYYGWIDAVFIRPNWLCPFFGLTMPRYSGRGLYWHFAVLAVAAASVACGVYLRVAAAVLAVCLTYVFLLDASYSLDLNHFYLMVLLSWLLALMPADGACSAAHGKPARAAPYWCLLLLRVQFLLVFFFAGLAKLSPEWLQATPASKLLAVPGTLPWLLPLLRLPYADQAMVYGGLILDLVLPWLWLWRRSRGLAFIITMAFMTLNGLAFHIGVFPFLVLSCTAAFLPARSLRVPVAPGSGRAARLLVPAYIGVQILLPLRAWLYPQPTGWSEEGHFFAWRMMLLDKDGSLQLTLRDPKTGATAVWDPSRDLTPLQLAALQARPLLALEYAHHVAATVAAHEHLRPEVYVTQQVRYGDHRPQLIIDPKIDLAAATRSIWPYPWLLPLAPAAD